MYKYQVYDKQIVKNAYVVEKLMEKIYIINKWCLSWENKLDSIFLINQCLLPY